MPRVLVALLAGLPAIALNTGALAAADLVPLGTAHGGLLHLLVMLTGGAVPSGAAFRIGFHVVVGLAMAVFYAFALENDELTQNVIDRFVVGAGKFANPE